MVTKLEVDKWAQQYYSNYKYNLPDPRGSSPSMYYYFNFEQQRWIKY